MMFDAVLIPGGGLDQSGRLPSWTKLRLDNAASETGSPMLVCLSAGTTHKPLPLDESGRPIFESTAAAEYLLASGVNPARVCCETSSYDTIGNAYFSRVTHATPRQLNRLVVVTSEFHMLRTEAIFSWVYSLADQNAKAGFEIEFRSTANGDVEAEVLAVRRKREAMQLKNLASVQETVRTLKDLHVWLFSQHAAYATHLSAVAVDKSGDAARNEALLRSY